MLFHARIAPSFVKKRNSWLSKRVAVSQEIFVLRRAGLYALENKI
jgi:hypothetical protein